MDRIASHPRHVMLGRRGAALAVKLLNKIQNDFLGSSYAVGTTLEFLSLRGGRSCQPALLTDLRNWKEPTMKTDMSPDGLTELTPK